MKPNPTLQYGEYDRPEPTGRVFITMEKTINGIVHKFVKKYKTVEGWMDISYGDSIDSCWAFSKSGAKKIIERLKARTYKDDFEKGILTFGTIDEYSV